MQKMDVKEGAFSMGIFGYARVSTRDQNLALQRAALEAAGCVKIYAEKASGARSDRPELQRMLRSLDPGASFKSLGDPWADTTTPHGRLMLTVLGGLAEFERELIKERTGEGRADAKARGVKFGRPRKLTHHQRAEAITRRAAGEKLADIARSYNVDPSMISRLWEAKPGPSLGC